jgi:hypothetical protein
VVHTLASGVISRLGSVVRGSSPSSLLAAPSAPANSRYSTWKASSVSAWALTRERSTNNTCIDSDVLGHPAGDSRSDVITHLDVSGGDLTRLVHVQTVQRGETCRARVMWRTGATKRFHYGSQGSQTLHCKLHAFHNKVTRIVFSFF